MWWIAWQLIFNRKKFSKKFAKEVKLAKVLFSINFIFIILNLPYTIYIAVQYLLGVNFFVTFGYRVVVVLQKIDYSCIFVVFFFSNKLFRQQVRSMIGCKNKATVPAPVAPAIVDLIQVNIQLSTPKQTENEKIKDEWG